MKKIFFLFTFALMLNAAQKTAIIKVEGMTCPLCTMAVKKSLKRIDGVIKAKVILNTKRATVIYDDKIASKTKLLEAIKRAGYKGKFILVR
jgi:mercuric ion binding protein